MAHRRLLVCTLCHLVVAPESGRGRWHYRCLLSFELLLIRNDAWAVGQIPLPFALWRSARSPDHTRSKGQWLKKLRKRKRSYFADSCSRLAIGALTQWRLSDSDTVTKPSSAYGERLSKSGGHFCTPSQLELW